MNQTPQQVDLNALSDAQLFDLAQALQIFDEKKKYNKQEFLYPDEGPLRRELYKKHLMFFKAGAFYKERALVAANRVGKSFAACSELSYHLNGKYPHWWEGKKFDHPIKAWSVGKTHETTRDILQNAMIGHRYEIGTGMIPKDDIEKTTSKPGTSDAILDVYIKHYTNGIYDGLSQLSFKSYVQGVEAFMGTSMDVIHLDEEPTTPNIYSECLTRTMTTNGIIMATFTPLSGLSDVVLSFLPGGRFPVNGFGPVETFN